MINLKSKNASLLQEIAKKHEDPNFKGYSE